MDIRSYLQRNAVKNGPSAGIRRGFNTPAKKPSSSPTKRSSEKEKKRRISSPLISDSDSEDPVPSKFKKSAQNKRELEEPKISPGRRQTKNRRVVVESDSEQSDADEGKASKKLTKLQKKPVLPTKKSPDAKQVEKRQKPEILPVVNIDSDSDEDFRPSAAKKIKATEKNDKVGKSMKKQALRVHSATKDGHDDKSKEQKPRNDCNEAIGSTRRSFDRTKNQESIQKPAKKLNPITVSDFFNSTTKVKTKPAPVDIKSKIAEKEVFSDEDFNDVLLQAEADLVSPAISTRSKAKTPVKIKRNAIDEPSSSKKTKTPSKIPKGKDLLALRKITSVESSNEADLFLEPTVPDEEWMQCQSTPSSSNKKAGPKSSENKKKDMPKSDSASPVTLKTRTTNITLDRRHDGFTKIVQPKLNGAAEEQPAALSEYQLLVERYKPAAVKQIIGQQGERSCVNKLLNWLRCWNSWHITKTREKRKGFGANDDGSCYKCVLLSGPPGVGKTTSAELCCKELGINIVSKNASDARSKKILESQIMETVCSHNVNEYYADNYESNAMDRSVPSHALIMDEVDGMSGTEDRAGIAELIMLIKKTRIPIICICNDRQAQKIRTLANHCYDLRFHRPQVSQIKGPMLSLTYKECLKVTPQQMEQIIEASNHDIRQVMNRLSLLTPQSQKETTKSTLNGDIALFQKDLTSNIFETVRVIFTDDSREDAKKRTWLDKCELFFSDYNLTPLFVFENYLNVESKTAKTMSDKLSKIADACEFMARGDCVEKQMRALNNWSLLNDQAIFSVVAPAESVKGYLKGAAQFPQWFGKNSKQNKIQRILTQLQMHTSLKTSCNATSFNLDYAPLLRDKILNPLISDATGVVKVMELLTYYDLTKEDMDNLLEGTQYPNSSNSLAKVAPKVKAALTRSYNKKPPMLPFTCKADALAVKKKKGSAIQKAIHEEDEGASDEEDVDIDEATKSELIDLN